MRIVIAICIGLDKSLKVLGQWKAETLYKDTSHPNEAGHQLMGKVIAEFLLGHAGAK